MKSDGVQRAIKSQRDDRSTGDAPNIGRVSRIQGTGMLQGIRRRKRGEERQAKNHRYVTSCSILAGVLAFLVLSAAVLFWISLQMGADVKHDKFQAQEPELIIGVVSKYPSPTEAEATALVRKGLAARNSASIAASFRIEQVTSEEISKFLGNLESTEGKLQRFVWLSKMDANRISLDGVLVYFENRGVVTQRLAILIPDSEGVWKIDFDAFSRNAKPSWKQLLAGEVDHSIVRIMLSPDTYYNGPFHDDKQWACYKLISLEAGQRLFGYCRVGSPQDSAIKSMMSEGNKAERATVEIRRVKESSEKQFEISAVIAEDWVVVDPPFENSFKE